MRILLAGSGTAGPVVPVLAVYKKIREEHPEAKFLFVGTKDGIEQRLAFDAGLKFESISAGKFRRYFSLKNLTAPFAVVAGFFQALSIIKKFDPDVVFGAGGYVCVPVMFAAYFRRKKIIIHQQDFVPSLTNKILAPFADKVTVSFKSSVKDFSVSSGLNGFKQEPKTVWTGNPYKEELNHQYSQTELQKIRKKYGIEEELPVITFVGGGTGAVGINNILKDALPELTRFAYIIHSSGAGKQISFKHPRYLPFATISNMPEAYAISDMVVSRAGLSTITELSILKKIAIIIPMPDSHQLYNALFLKQRNAALVLNQDYLTGEELVSIIRILMYDSRMQTEFRQNIAEIMPADSTRKIAKIITDLCHSH